ncbi:MAG: CYTH domain-containing protein [Halomonas sp.]|uniref:CYTH domain-containing protein n=1 Tax=Halomonas sp. TaxID=1486246 RepID=UPI003F8E389B
MAHEIELKLALDTRAAALLRGHHLLVGATAACRQLRNTYFDTPDGVLEASGIALRLRYDGQRHIQTLKTRGQSAGGLSRRGEWEWELSAPALDINLLDGLPTLAGLNRQQLSRLSAIFTTDFQRETWLLESPGATIEAALDQGEIYSDQAAHRINICELELELKRGEASALLDLAEKLAEQVPVRPSDTSKAARGNALRGKPWQLPPPSAPLQRALVALDALNDTGQPQWFIQARKALDRLAESADAGISRPAAALREGLDHAAHLPDWSLHCGQQALRLVRQLADRSHNCQINQG